MLKVKPPLSFRLCTFKKIRFIVFEVYYGAEKVFCLFTIIKIQWFIIDPRAPIQVFYFSDEKIKSNCLLYYVR